MCELILHFPSMTISLWIYKIASFGYYNIKILKSIVITTAEVVKASAGSHSGFFVGATPQNDNEDELYDDADVSEDDFAEFDIDEDDEAPNSKVNIKIWYIAVHKKKSITFISMFI